MERRESGSHILSMLSRLRVQPGKVCGLGKKDVEGDVMMTELPKEQTKKKNVSIVYGIGIFERKKTRRFILFMIQGGAYKSTQFTDDDTS